MIRQTVTILKQEKVTEGLFSICFDSKEIANAAKPGQFITVYLKDESRLLPRPFGICEVDKSAGVVRIIYRTVGKGTNEMASYTAGTKVDIMGPLGNGFDIKNKKAILIGGGTGIPIMLELAKTVKNLGEGFEKAKDSVIAIGYRDETFMTEEFEQYLPVFVSTESGICGTKGNVIDAIKANGIEAEVIYACGPIPMLRALKEYAKEHNVEAQISLEEKMACGIGACLACVCKSKEKDGHSNVNNKRICKEGPVFDSEDIEL